MSGSLSGLLGSNPGILGGTAAPGGSGGLLNVQQGGTIDPRQLAALQQAMAQQQYWQQIGTQGGYGNVPQQFRPQVGGQPTLPASWNTGRPDDPARDPARN